MASETLVKILDFEDGKDPCSSASRLQRGHGRTKKRKFTGNRHSTPWFTKNSSKEKATPATVREATQTSAPSASRWKIPETPSISSQGPAESELIDFNLIFDAVRSVVGCKKCGGDVEFDRTARVGLGFKLNIFCVGECSTSLSKTSSSHLIDATKIFDVNKRLNMAMRLQGVGRAGTEMFCHVMDLPNPVSQHPYDQYVMDLRDATQEVCESSMSQAAEREKTLPDPPSSNVSVSGDGTWRKHGFSSLYGVQALVGDQSKQVLDVNISSAFCQECTTWEKQSGTAAYEDWLENHIPNCKANYEGSASGMESAGVLCMFQRSKEKHDIIYENYIGDADSSTYKNISTANPYKEDNVKVKKLECCGHVQKRVGKRLRDLKKKKTICADGKGLGGVGRLTDAVIDELQVWYGNGIRGNKDSVPDMQNAIWASFYHVFSSDASPKHHLCPKGKDSWCKYQIAKASRKLKSFKHTKNIPKCVMEVVKPVFDTLTKTELLEGCLGGKTQNNNESLHQLVWKIAPKHLSSGLQVVEIAAYVAVIMFNDGNVSLLQVMEKMGIKPGRRAILGMDTKDYRRISDSNKAGQSATKEARQHNLRKRKAQQEAAIGDDSLFYVPGGF